MPATQTQLNHAYGLQVRLDGLIRRGADQDKIDSVREQYEAAMKKIKESNHVSTDNK